MFKYCNFYYTEEAKKSPSSFLLLFNFRQICRFINTFNSHYNTKHKPSSDKLHQNFHTKKKMVWV